MAFVSVLDFAVEKTFDGANVGKGDADLDDTVVEGSAVVVGADSRGSSARTGVGAGLGPPILRVIVGAGGGASVCCGRSMGGGGGLAGCCGGSEKLFPGTNAKAPALSLLIVCIIRR